MSNKPGQADLIQTGADGSNQSWVELDSSGVSIVTPSQKLKVSEAEGILFNGQPIAAGGVTVTQVAHGFTVGQVVYLSGSSYALAKADTAADAEVAGIVTAVGGANTFTIATSGRVTGLSGLTAGTVYFLSPSSAGALTATEPSTVGQVSKPLLLADGTTSGYFINMRGQLIPAASPYTVESIPASGSLGETVPRWAASNGAAAAPATGNVRAAAIWLSSGTLITHISFSSGTTPLGTGTHQVFGLYDSAATPNLLATTTDDTSTAWLANTVKTLALSSPASYSIPSTGWYNVAILVAATTVPSLATTSGVIAGVAGLTPYPVAEYGSGAYTALPSTLTSPTSKTPVPWAMVS